MALARRARGQSLTDSVILGILRQCVAVNFGDIGAGAALSSVAVKYWDPATGLGVVRCGRDVHREVWCCMTLLRDVKGRSVTVRVLHNGGTLRSSQAAALRHSEEAYERMEKNGAVRGDAAKRELGGGAGDRLAPAVIVSSSSWSPGANPRP